jgi:hypothetical protein
MSEFEVTTVEFRVRERQLICAGSFGTRRPARLKFSSRTQQASMHVTLHVALIVQLVLHHRAVSKVQDM